MNNLIYKWLQDNKDIYNETSTTSTIIESIVILSINGILIEYNSLINYCNINNEYKLINDNSNKRHNNSNENKQSSLHGLNDNQFQILHNNIQSKLIPLFKNNDDTNNTNTNIIDYNNIKNKYDCLIAIISENNINNLNNNTLQQQQQIGNKKMKTTSSTTTSGTIIKNDINYLFFKVWRNVVIKNEILFHTQLYKKHINVKFEISPDQLLQYKYKSYINDLVLIDHNDEIELPSNLNHIGFFLFKQKIFNVNSLQRLQSLTSISLTGAFNQSLDGGWLPGNIKHLEFGFEFKQPIKVGHLPQSLTSLKLQINYEGVIEYGSIPSSVNTLKYIVNSINDENKIPFSTTNLKYDDYFNKAINIKDIPYNVTSLEFGRSFNSEIQENSLPHSIRSLVFGKRFRKEIKAGTLPPNLTSLVFGKRFNQQLSSNLIPSSITSLEFNFCESSFTPGLFSHTNLQSLKFKGKLNSFLYNTNTLPNTLTHLDVYERKHNYHNHHHHHQHHQHFFNQLQQQPTQQLNKAIFPTSLCSLVFNGNDVKVGDLPKHLTSVGFYNDIDLNVQIGSLSSGNLKKLTFNKPIDGKLDLTVDGLLPQSLESITINCNDINCLNSFNSKFFIDKVKLINNN